VKRKIFSVLLTLVLVLGFSLVTAVPVAAVAVSIFNVTDGTYTTEWVTDETGNIEATLTGTWDSAVIGDFTATGIGLLYVQGMYPDWGTTADISVSGTLSAEGITFSGTAVRTVGDPITDDAVTGIAGTITILSDGNFGAALTGNIAGGYTVDIDITGDMVRPITNERTAESFFTIQAAIDEAIAGDTISVGTGTYEEDLVIPDTKTNLELAGATGATIKGVANVPKASWPLGVPNIEILAGGVKIHGFTIEGPDYVADYYASGIILDGIDIEIYDNDFVTTAAETIDELAHAITTISKAVLPTADVSGLNIHDNTFTGYGAIGSEFIYIDPHTGTGAITIDANQFSGSVYVGITAESGEISCTNNTINNETVGSGLYGIRFMDTTYLANYSNILVSGNTIQNTVRAIRVGNGGAGASVFTAVISNNTLTNNDIGVWGRLGNHITAANNTIVGNTVGVQNDDTTVTINAENNWWGDASGPTHTSNPSGTGDEVTDNVDFDPWLYPPTVVTAAASSLSTTSATLNGSLDDLGNASSVDVSFEWGTTTAYGNETSTQEMTSTGTFTASLTGLSSNTTYHFRVKAVGASPDVYGDDITFTTAPAPPPPPPPPPPPTIDTELFDTEASFETNSDGEIQETIVATSEDENVTITIEEGTIALDEEGEPLETLTAAVDETPPDPPEDANIIGLAYNFGPGGATFDPAITLEYTYDPDALPEGVAEEDLVLAYYDEAIGEWVELDCVIDTENNTITASIAHFTTFAIIGVVPVVVPLAPAVFIVSSLGISPSEVAPSEEVNTSVLVANTGGESGSYTVVLKIDGVKESEKRVTVAAGDSQTVSFSVTREEAGSYTITVDGLSSSFAVVPVVVPPEPAAFSVSYLSVSPRLEVEPGETVTITVMVANTGGESGSYTVVLKIDGVKEADETVTVAAGDSQDVSFSVTREEADSYTVAVDGLSGSFTVVAPEEEEEVPTKPGINWPLIGGIIGGVVVVAGLLYYFLVFRRRAY